MNANVSQPGKVIFLCRYCGVEKEEKAFEVCKVLGSKVYRRKKCSECKSRRAADRRREVRRWLDLLKRTLVCSQCSFADHRALEFHHPDHGTKGLNIGDMAKDGRSIAAIQEEIKKCVVLCANCHRIKHYTDPLSSLLF